MRHWAAHHLLAPDMRLTVDPLDRPVVLGAPPQWPHTWDMAVRTMRMAPRGQRAEWPGAEHLLATAQAAQVQQPAGNDKDGGVCALMSALGTLLRVPRPGNLLSTLDRRWVAAVVLNRDMGPIARVPSLGELPAAVLDALPTPRAPLDVADVPHNVGLPGARMQHALLCMAAAADGGMSMLMTVSPQHVQDAAAAYACPPAVGRERQAVAAGGERASHPYGGHGGYGEAGGVGRGGVLGLCSGGSRGTGMDRCHRVPAQEAAVQGPGLLQGVKGVPQGARPGAQGAQVHGWGHPAGAGGLRGGNATAEGPGAARLACSPKQHVES